MRVGADHAGLPEERVNGSRRRPRSSAPVCEPAARAPAADRPALTARTGLLAATRRAIRAKRRGLPNDSKYRSTSAVCGSCSQNCSRSLGDRSARLPIDANADSPSPSASACSSSAIPTPPLCEDTATLPGRGAVGANVAFRPAGVLSTPRQLGPTSRIPVARHRDSRSRWRSAPSAPVSAKPAEMTTRLRTPFAAHSCATSQHRSGRHARRRPGRPARARPGSSGAHRARRRCGPFG